MATDKKVQELEAEVAHWKAKFTSVRRRHVRQQEKMTIIFRKPLRFLLWRWYHTYIKRDQIV